MSDFIRGGLYIDGIFIAPCDCSDTRSSGEPNKSSTEYPAFYEKYDAINNRDKSDLQDTHSPTRGSNDLLWWELPGHGEKSKYCGDIRSVLACPNPDHRHDPKNVKKICISCGKATCPICYEAWASKGAHVATDRIDKIEDLYSTIGMPLGDIRHIIFSPPQGEAKELMKTKSGFKRLRKQALAVIKSAGVVGGLIVFHAERHNRGGWYSSPHFHVLGYGYLEDVRTFHRRTGGWVYKNAGKRESVYATIRYQLSHCGIAIDRNLRNSGRPFQVVNWFGALSYYYISKAETVKEAITIDCKVCGEPLHSYRCVSASDNGSMDWSESVDDGVYYLKVKTVYYELRHLAQLHARYEVGMNGFLQNRKKTKADYKRNRFVDKFGKFVTWVTGDTGAVRENTGKREKSKTKWIDTAKVGDLKRRMIQEASPFRAG